MPTSGGSAANSSLNAAGGVTANPIPTPVAGTPGIPTPGVTGGTTNTQRSTEPFPLSMPAPSSPYVGTPIFIQP
jgi:hypothetical protein